VRVSEPNICGRGRCTTIEGRGEIYEKRVKEFVSMCPTYTWHSNQNEIKQRRVEMKGGKGTNQDPEGTSQVGNKMNAI
jgi:hypothetical protein